MKLSKINCVKLKQFFFQNYDKENEVASLWKQLAEQCQVNSATDSRQQEIEHYKW